MISDDKTKAISASDRDSILFSDYQKGLITDAAMMAGLRDMVAKIASHIAYKFSDKYIPERTQALQEDLQQEIWMLLITKIKDGYDMNMSSLSKYVYAAAYNRTVSHYNGNVAYHIEDHDPSRALEDETHYEPYEHDFEGDADRERAHNKIRKALKLRELAGRAKDHFGDEPPEPKKISTKGPGTGIQGDPQYTLSDNQQELRSILEILSLDSEEAAAILGIKKPTLASYLYGKTTDVPHDIMNASRNLLTNVKLIRERDAYESDMKTLLAEWCRQIGVSDMNLDALADYLGVHLVTLQRWRQGRKPSSASFRRHYRKIQSFKKK